jgi:hypothetical protein
MSVYRCPWPPVGGSSEPKTSRDLRSLVPSSGLWTDDDLPSTDIVLSQVHLLSGDGLPDQRWLEDLAARALEQHRIAAADVLSCLVLPSVPILFFGDSARYARSPTKVVTVGLNPSREEFPQGDSFQRFADCAEMSGAGEPDLGRYIGSLNAYFSSTADPYDRWFRPSFEPVLQGMGAS